MSDVPVWFDFAEARALTAPVPLTVEQAQALASAHRKIGRALRRAEDRKNPTSYHEVLADQAVFG